MSFQPRYLPPTNTKKRKQQLVVLVAFLLVIASGLFVFLNQRAPQEVIKSQLPTICHFDTQQTQESLASKDSKQLEIVRDYLYYGETLTLYNQPYQLGQRDPFMGKQINLENLCDNTIVSFLFTNTIDGNIPVEELDVGFYAVSVERDLEYYYLSSNEVIEDVFYTISRDSKSKKIEIIADENYFVDEANELKLFNNHRVFIKVSEVDSPSEIIDIVIDPAHNDQDFGPIDSGYQDDGFNESQWTYELSQAVSKRLEDYGLRVSLTRKANELMDTYGNPGRVYHAFETQAKLMIEIDGSTEADEGFSILGSSYALLSLPEFIVEEVIDKTNLPIEQTNSRIGAFYNPVIEDLDYHNLIRESGGYSLGATQYSEISSRLNQFAKDNRHGTQTIAINLGNITNESYRNQISQEYNEIVEAITQGIVKYLNINR